MTKLLVVGGTGSVGREVVRIAQTRGLPIKVLARDPARARALLGPSVELVKGDLEDPSSLAAAVEGVRAVALATAPGPEMPQQETNFVEVARAARLDRIVYLSAFKVPSSPIAAWHATSEEWLRSSGIPHVILRPVMFMSNFLKFDVESVRTGRVFSVFKDGRMSWVDPIDVAELTLLALTSTAPITKSDSEWVFGGPEALTYDEIAGTFTRVLGRPVEHVRVDEATFRNAPLPAFVQEAVIATAAHVRRGMLVVSDAVVTEKLGRRARSFQQWVDAHRDTFA